MTDESYSFTAAKTRLDEIVTQVRKKDTSLEKSLDLLEEGVRLANVCTELIDHTDWVTPPSGSGEAAEAGVEAGVEAAEPVEASADAADAADAGAAATTGADADEATGADAETGSASAASDVEVGDVWSEDEAWAEDSDDDPSDGDDGHGV